MVVLNKMCMCFSFTQKLTQLSYSLIWLEIFVKRKNLILQLVQLFICITAACASPCQEESQSETRLKHQEKSFKKFNQWCQLFVKSKHFNLCQRYPLHTEVCRNARVWMKRKSTQATVTEISDTKDGRKQWGCVGWHETDGDCVAEHMLQHKDSVGCLVSQTKGLGSSWLYFLVDFTLAMKGKQREISDLA